MSEALVDWPRDYYEESDQKPFLFYVVFGADPGDLKLSRSKHRCDEIPDAVDISFYGPDSNPEVVDQFRDGFLWEKLRQQNPDLAALISAQDKCVIVHGDIENDETLNYFRNAIGALTALLDTGSL